MSKVDEATVLALSTATADALPPRAARRPQTPHGLWATGPPGFKPGRPAEVPSLPCNRPRRSGALVTEAPRCLLAATRCGPSGRTHHDKVKAATQDGRVVFTGLPRLRTSCSSL